MIATTCWAKPPEGVILLETSEKNNYYALTAVMESPYEPAAIWALIDDFNRLPRINPAVTKVEILVSPYPDIRRVRLHTRACVFIFCKHLTHTQDVVRTGHWQVTAVIVPQDGEFTAGWASWSLQARRQGGSQLTIQWLIVPDFWVPPLLGPYIIKKKLRSEAVDTLRGLERLIEEAREDS